jgi:hypothetical protein
MVWERLAGGFLKADCDHGSPYGGKRGSRYSRKSGSHLSNLSNSTIVVVLLYSKDSSFLV